MVTFQFPFAFSDGQIKRIINAGEFSFAVAAPERLLVRRFVH
jgi:hypothetical protein